MAANNASSWNPSIGCPVRVSAFFSEGVLGFCSGIVISNKSETLELVYKINIKKNLGVGKYGINNQNPEMLNVDTKLYIKNYTYVFDA
uniref:Uncharacterized protein n=1 Tax=Planktothricoides sp. SpSt-374 TaxID=2282167 RepID=A0A7C3VTZ3_9CYAN